LVGTGVGALAGAAVGAELEAQEGMLAAHKSTIERQEEEIRRQRDELENIKAQGYDLSMNSEGRYIIPKYNRSSRNISDEAIVYNKRPRATLYQSSVKTPSVPSSRTLQEDDILASKYNSEFSTAAKLPAAKTIPAAKTEPKIEVAIEAADEDLEIIKPVASLPKKVEKKKAAPAKKVVMAPKPRKLLASGGEEKHESIVKEAKQEAKKELAALAPKGSTCEDADREAKRARTAASDTDKLFYYRRALRLCKTKPEYHIEIGRVYSSIGRREEAEFEFSRALEIDPDNREAQDELTMLMLDNTY
jgi:tetratricopeptide (TPR) repeat protein